MRNPAIILAGKTNFPQLAALIARLDLLVSIDTVAIHIAAATNTPTVGIYGKTYIYKWTPWNKDKQTIITHYHYCGACWLGDYYDRIVPTHTKTNICRKDNICIKGISAQEVIAAAKNLLAAHSKRTEKLALKA